MNTKKILLLLAACTMMLLSAAACGTKNEPAAASENGKDSSSAAKENDSANQTSKKEGSDASAAQNEWSLAIDTTTLDGDTMTSADFQDNTLTVLNVWATWCPPCVEELPHLQEMSELFKGENVQIVGILQDGVSELLVRDEEAIEAAKQLLTEAGAEYAVILPDETIMTAFISQMQYFPTTFFIDSEGNVVKTEIGANDAQGWEDTINEVLEEVKK